MQFTIRLAQPADVPEIAAMCAMLWPDGSIEEHRSEVVAKISSGISGTLPVAILLSQDASGSLTGFVEIGLRSHADGCDTSRPVGYIEGWFVRQAARRQGIGKELIYAAEAWARQQGCIEMASDALLGNPASLRAHVALGFEEVDRCVHFRKKLET